MANNQTNNVGVSFLGVLTLIFIVLKLTDVIAWSWWWITAPLWAPIVLVIIGAVIVTIAKIIIEGRRSRKSSRY